MNRVVFKGVLQQVEIVYAKDVSLESYPHCVITDIVRPCKADPNPNMSRLESASYERYKDARRLTIPIWNVTEIQLFQMDSPDDPKFKVVGGNFGKDKTDS